ncbi:TBC1 domain family member whacked, partial [Frankliniella fusca]
MQEIMCTWS